MRLDLLGYLLNALDNEEREAFERRLTSDPELRREYETLRRRLTSVEDPAKRRGRDEDPPEGLAERTCKAIFGPAESERSAATPAPRSSRVRLRPTREPGRSTDRQWLDTLMAAAACIMVAVILFPALAQSRFQSRVNACQHNLQLLGIGLISYSLRSPEGIFPPVSTDGPLAISGAFGPILKHHRYLEEDDTTLWCPGTPDTLMAEMTVPTIEELVEAEGTELETLQQRAGGNTGYNLGYVHQGRHVPLRNLGRANFAIAGDAPSLHLRDGRSANHGGLGQNLLFENGRVVFVTEAHAPAMDHPYRNRDGYLEAGLGKSDAVLGRSETRPFASGSMPPHGGRLLEAGW